MDSLCPQPPDWRVDWKEIDRRLSWIQALRGCPQDPVHHAEGDVWTHVRMVCEALAAMEAWRSLGDEAREDVFWAALLHDVAKPACNREFDGRVTSPGHAGRGAGMARRLLWEMGTPFLRRERVVQLVRHHALPLWAIERDDGARSAILCSWNVRCDRLALLAEADARGRRCDDRQRLLDNVALFVELCREQRCLSARRTFSSEHARFLYARGEWPHCDVPPFEDFGSEVVLISGLPGAGKDHWIRRHLPGWPVISLDDIRKELGISPAGHQGKVVQEARRQARDHLRQGTPFVWNATNLSRRIRDRCVNLGAAYRARLRIVYLEVSPERLRRQNRERGGGVPEAVVERLFKRWQVPDPYEGHRVEYWVEGQPVGTAEDSFDVGEEPPEAIGDH